MPFQFEDLARHARQAFPRGWDGHEFVFFAPVDQVHAVLLEVINSASHRVLVNQYGYDDPEIDAVLHAKAASPTITFFMNLDSSQAGGVHERVLLAPWSSSLGTSIAVGRSAKKAISHLKVCIIDGLYTISGSTNWSASGESAQDNELTVSRDPLKAARFESTVLFNHAEMLRQMAAKQTPK